MQVGEQLPEANSMALTPRKGHRSVTFCLFFPRGPLFWGGGHSLPLPGAQVQLDFLLI